MRIQSNIAALQTHNRLKANQTKLNKTLEKLSSGYQINRAGDDAAGLAISEKMRSQIRGLNMANKNIQNSVSLIQTAEGALHEVHAILQRARELAVQASNDTNVAQDREALQKEIEEIVKEIDKISETTEFNTQKLLQVTEVASNFELIEHVDVIASWNSSLSNARLTKDNGLIGIYSNKAYKLDAQGNDQWMYDPGVNMLVDDLIETADGGYAVLYTNGATSNNAKVHVQKLYSNRNVVWDTLISNQYITEGLSLIESANGDFFVGATGSGIQNTDVIAAKLSASGQLEKSAKLGSPQSSPYAYGADQIKGLLQNTDGTFYIYGENVLKNGAVYSNQKTWAAKVDSNFNVVWDHVDGGTGMNSIFDGIITSDGGLISVGTYREGTAIKGYIYKMDSNGQKAWGKIMDDTSRLGSVIKDQDGNLFVGGDYNNHSALFVFNEAGAHLKTVSLQDTGMQGTISEIVVAQSGELLLSNSRKTFKVNNPLDNSSANPKTKQLIFQVGANVNQNVKVDLVDVSSKSLRISNVNITSHKAAALSISTIDKAIQSISTFRSSLGAVHNRLQHTLQSNQVTYENLQTAESSIRDTDIAKEMMQMVKQNILVDVATSMLAQAQKAPESILQMLN